MLCGLTILFQAIYSKFFNDGVIVDNSAIEKSSPCERLSRVVKKISEANPEESILAGWAFVFDLPKTSTFFDVVPYIKSFSDLIEECKKIVELFAYERNKPKYIKALNTLLGLPGHIDFRGKFKPIHDRVTQLLVNDLEYCANELRDYYSEVVIPKEELEGLLEDVLRLKKSILELSLDVEIKSHCLKLLNALEEAILDYKIKGIESLVDVMYTQYKRLDEILKVLKPEEQNKFKKLFVRVKNCVILASDVHSASTLALAAVSQIDKIIS